MLTAAPWWIPGATVGSCAQIGKNVHLSGGAGIGGVLEPLQAGPVIIEDDRFIGARSEVVEGVVERGAVLSMGVFIGASTKIIDRETGDIYVGRVPAYSVVMPGTLPGKPLPDGHPRAEPGLRRHHQKGRREDTLENLDQRSAARLTDAMTSLQPEHTLLQELIRCPSVTPAEGGALDLLEARLSAAGLSATGCPSVKGKPGWITCLRFMARPARIWVLPGIRMWCPWRSGRLEP